MWAHRPWQGRWLPEGLGRDAQLAAYATWCTAVEGNTTFYGAPSPATVASWAAQTSDRFRFAFKLPRSITHDRRLRDAAAEAAAFLERLEPLGVRADPVVIQLPASFGPDQLGHLARFVGGLPRTHRFAVEVRHPGFFTLAPGMSASTRTASTRTAGPGVALDRLLRRHDVEWIIFDTVTLFARPPSDDAEREAWGAKPRVPRRIDALTDRPVVRYIGRSDVAATIRGWEPWKPVVAQWLEEGRRPLFFVHTPDNVASLDLARRFHHEMRALVPGLAPLPEPLRPTPTTLF